MFLKNRDFLIDCAFVKSFSAVDSLSIQNMGRKDETNAILANLRSKIFKIFRGGGMQPGQPR